MKKLTALILAALMLFAALALTSCGTKGKTLDQIKSAGKLVVATSAEFPPFEDLQGDGTFVGIEMDLAKLICDKLGVELVIENMSFDSILTGVQAGKFDVGIAGISIDEDRKKNTLFSDPYCLAAQSIIVPEGSAITGKADLAGKKISVQTGTTAEKYCLENGYDVNSYENNSDAELALTSGKVDAWVIDDLTAAEMVAAYNDGNESKLVILDDAMTTEPYAFGFALGSDDLIAEINKIIADLIADGTVAGLFEKYGAPYTSPVK